MSRHKLRNVRFRQWRRWLAYRDSLPTDQSKLSVPLAWSRTTRWLR